MDPIISEISDSDCTRGDCTRGIGVVGVASAAGISGECAGVEEWEIAAAAAASCREVCSVVSGVASFSSVTL